MLIPVSTGIGIPVISSPLGRRFTHSLSSPSLPTDGFLWIPLPKGMTALSVFLLAMITAILLLVAELVTSAASAGWPIQAACVLVMMRGDNSSGAAVQHQ